MLCLDLCSSSDASSSWCHSSGPVLVDVPKDIQQQLHIPDWEEPMSITGYISRLPAPPEEGRLKAVVEAIKGSKKPVRGAPFRGGWKEWT